MCWEFEIFVYILFILNFGYDFCIDNNFFFRDNLILFFIIFVKIYIICFLGQVFRFVFSFINIIKENIFMVYIDNDIKILGKEMVFDLFLQ